MFTRSKFIACLSILALLVVEGCADSVDEPSANVEANTLECGPNSTLHKGLGAGAEDHCDCDPGYQLYDGECLSDDSPEFNTEPPTEPENNEEEPEERALPIACWLAPGSTCDPRNGGGCDLAAGDTCDLATTPEGELNIFCLPGPNTQLMDQSCDPAAGPFCAVGMHCVDPGSCKNFCCDDSDCGNQEQCKAFSEAAGTLGVCDDGSTAAPACSPPGGPCQTGADCCSNNCHAGHCH